MLGAIIGDIVGSRFEFNNTNIYDFKLFDDECNYTDDTICTIAVADGILSGSSYADKIHSWCRSHPMPMGGYGGSFAHWVASDNPQPYNSFGNGSAMRVSPVAWAFNSLNIILAEAEKTAIVTHNHPEGIKGALAVAHAIYHLRSTHDMPGLEAIMNTYYPDFMSKNYIPGMFDETCQGTVPVCLKILISSTSFEDAIRKAVSWGGDSDTIGAIVGSMAEAQWGIPTEIARQAFKKLTIDMIKVISNFYCKYLYEKSDLTKLCQYYNGEKESPSQGMMKRNHLAIWSIWVLKVIGFLKKMVTSIAYKKK